VTPASAVTAPALGVAPLTRLFRALGDETRLRMVALLAHGELCGCHFETALGVGQPNVSRHLGVLRAAGVVVSRREGPWVYYAIAPQAHAATAAMLSAVIEAFGAARAVRADHARLRRACGPDACR
jgi:ArsR family transcriptional regulator